MGAPRALVGAEMEPPQWSLEVALRGAGQGQGWVSCPGVTPGICQHPPQLLPLPHSLAPWALGLWAVSPACPLPASVGAFTWVNIDLVSLSTSSCPFPVQGATSGRGKGSCVGSGESDGRAGLRALSSAKTELFRELTSPGLQAGSRRCQTSDTDLGSGEQAAVPRFLQEVSPGPPTLSGCADHTAMACVSLGSSGAPPPSVVGP